MESLGIGLLGVGLMGRYHAQCLKRAPSLRLVAVCDTDADAAKGVATETGAVALDHLDSLLAHPGVDAVIVATPTLMHHVHTLAALRAGKHVLVEKPMANILAEAQEMVSVADEAGLTLMVGQVMRFMPNFVKVRTLIENGVLGRLIHFSERRLECRAQLAEWWRKQDNLLIAHRCSHTLDLLQWLFDLPVAYVYCAASANHPGFRGEDDFCALFRLAGGSYAILQHSLVCHETVHDMLMTGERGTIRIEGFAKVYVNGEAVYSEDPARTLLEGLTAELVEFAWAVCEGREALTSGRQVLPTVATIDAAVASSRSGRMVAVQGVK